MPEPRPALLVSETPGRWGAALTALALAAAVFLLALGSIWFTSHLGRVAAIWPGNAVVLFALRRRPDMPKRILLAGLAATVCANLAAGDPLARSFGLAACNGLEVFLCAWLMARAGGRGADLVGQRNLIVFLAAAALAPVASGLGAALILSTGDAAAFVGDFKAWYAPDALGLLIVTPVLLALRRNSFTELGDALRRPRGWISVAVLAVTLAAVFGQDSWPLYFLLPPALILIAFQLNVTATALSVLLVALTSVVMTMAGHGGVTRLGGDLAHRLHMMQVFMASLALTILPVAAAIEKRRKLEADLREANRLSALAQQVAGIGYWRNDLVTGQRTWSDRTYEIHGTTRAGADPYAPGGLDHYHPDDRPQIRQTLAQAAADGAPFDIKVRLQRVDDGRERVVHFKGEAERDAARKVVAIFGVMRDVTEEESARQRIEESEARFRQLADASTDIVLKVDRDDVISYASPSVRRYGYEPEDLIGVSGFSLVHPDDLAKLQALIAELFSTGRVEAASDRTYRVRTADGAYVWMEGSPTIVQGENGAPVAVISQLRDVTERRLALDALAESELRYRIVATHATDIISRTGADGRILYISPSVTRIMGRPSEELVGRSVLPWAHPDDRERVATAFIRLMSGELPSGHALTFRARHADGRWIWLERTLATILDAQGKAMETVEVTRDVSARVSLEEQLRTARDAAEEATAVKSSFLANMSHEIRTPLTAILGFTSLLSEKGGMDDTSNGWVRRIASSGQALLSIVNDVLDFSKLEAGQFEIARRPVNPAEVLHETLIMFSPMAEAKGLALAFTDGEGLPDAVLMDPDRMRQVLVNLIGNAVKFTDAGSVRLVASYDRSTQRLAVRVEDTGAGLDEEQQQKLFQRFSQVDASSTRRHGGTGLGLAICKGLAEAMGGAIGVDSRPGSGSAFHFEIDAPLAERPAESAAGGAAPAGLNGVRVLVVDDNPVNRELARALLESFGAEVSEAEDGVAGVRAAMALPVDVILLDIRMPGMDGPEALRAIRSGAGPNSDVPILAFTADADADELGEAHGFDGVVRKPISTIDLVQAVDQAIHWDAPQADADVQAAH